MQITDVRLRKVSNGTRVKAIASITLDSEFVIHEIKLLENSQGELFVAMPSRRIKSTGQHRDICHPINPQSREKITNAILEEYNNSEDEPNAENA